MSPSSCKHFPVRHHSCHHHHVSCPSCHPNQMSPSPCKCFSVRRPSCHHHHVSVSQSGVLHVAIIMPLAEFCAAIIHFPVNNWGTQCSGNPQSIQAMQQNITAQPLTKHKPYFNGNIIEIIHENSIYLICKSFNAHTNHYSSIL